MERSGVAPGADGAFERFLTAAIATIITIMFSWRLLDEENQREGGATRSSALVHRPQILLNKSAPSPASTPEKHSQNTVRASNDDGEPSIKTDTVQHCDTLPNQTRTHGDFSKANGDAYKPDDEGEEEDEPSWANYSWEEDMYSGIHTRRTARDFLSPSKPPNGHIRMSDTTGSPQSEEMLEEMYVNREYRGIVDNPDFETMHISDSSSESGDDDEGHLHLVDSDEELNPTGLAPILEEDSDDLGDEEDDDTEKCREHRKEMSKGSEHEKTLNLSLSRFDESDTQDEKILHESERPSDVIKHEYHLFTPEAVEKLGKDLDILESKLEDFEDKILEEEAVSELDDILDDFDDPVCDDDEERSSPVRTCAIDDDENLSDESCSTCSSSVSVVTVVGAETESEQKVERESSEERSITPPAMIAEEMLDSPVNHDLIAFIYNIDHPADAPETPVKSEEIQSEKADMMFTAEVHALDKIGHIGFLDEVKEESNLYVETNKGRGENPEEYSPENNENLISPDPNKSDDLQQYRIQPEVADRLEFPDREEKIFDDDIQPREYNPYEDDFCDLMNYSGSDDDDSFFMVVGNQGHLRKLETFNNLDCIGTTQGLDKLDTVDEDSDILDSPVEIQNQEELPDVSTFSGDKPVVFSRIDEVTTESRTRCYVKDRENPAAEDISADSNVKLYIEECAPNNHNELNNEYETPLTCDMPDQSESRTIAEEHDEIGELDENTRALNEINSATSDVEFIDSKAQEIEHSSMCEADFIDSTEHSVNSCIPPARNVRISSEICPPTSKALDGSLQVDKSKEINVVINELMEEDSISDEGDDKNYTKKKETLNRVSDPASQGIHQVGDTNNSSVTSKPDTLIDMRQLKKTTDQWHNQDSDQLTDNKDVINITTIYDGDLQTMDDLLIIEEPVKHDTNKQSHSGSTDGPDSLIVTDADENQNKAICDSVNQRLPPEETKRNPTDLNCLNSEEKQGNNDDKSTSEGNQDSNETEQSTIDDLEKSVLPCIKRLSSVTETPDNTDSPEKQESDNKGVRYENYERNLRIWHDYLANSGGVDRSPAKTPSTYGVKKKLAKISRRRTMPKQYTSVLQQPVIPQKTSQSVVNASPAKPLPISRQKIFASRQKFLSAENLCASPMQDRFAHHKATFGHAHIPSRQNRYQKREHATTKIGSRNSSLDRLNHISSYYSSRYSSDDSFEKPELDALHEDCIFSPHKHEEILNTTQSIDNLHPSDVSLRKELESLHMKSSLMRYGSVASLETDIDTGETTETLYVFTETDLDSDFDLQNPISRAFSMSELSTKGKPAARRGRFADRNVPKSKSLQTLETDIDDVFAAKGEGNLHRVPSVHELRVTKSLSKLNVPDWFKNSSVSRSGSTFSLYSSQRRDSTSTTSSFGYPPSLTASPCPSVTPGGNTVVIKTRVTPVSAKLLRAPKLPVTPEKSPISLTNVSLPSDKFRKKEKPKELMPIPIVPFSKLRLMFETRSDSVSSSSKSTKDTSSHVKSPVQSPTSPIPPPVISQTTRSEPAPTHAQNVKLPPSILKKRDTPVVDKLSPTTEFPTTVTKVEKTVIEHMEAITNGEVDGENDAQEKFSSSAQPSTSASPAYSEKKVKAKQSEQNSKPVKQSKSAQDKPPVQPKPNSLKMLMSRKPNASSKSRKETTV